MAAWYCEQSAKETQTQGKVRSHFNASECGACTRRLCYSMSGAPAKNSMAGWLLGRAGKHLHVGFERDFESAFGTSVETEISLRFIHTAVVAGKEHSFEVHARLDLLWPGYRWLGDIKTMSDNAWVAFCRDGVQARRWFLHFLEQLNLYALGVETDRMLKINRLWVIPVNRTTGDLLLEASTTYPADLSVLAPVWERWAQVQNSLRSEALPERPYKRPSIECVVMCGYQTRCWKEDK
jgi:hypothetical protein